MGIIRKTFSVGTFGLIDYRSGKDAARRGTAKAGKAAAKASKAEAKLYKTQAKQALAEAPAAPSLATFPAPGWYPSTTRGYVTWWDGQRWTGDIRPI